MPLRNTHPKILAITLLTVIALFDIHLNVFLQGGVMQTHDEETRKFFKHSSIICVLSPRYASSKLSIFKQKVSLQA